MVPVDVALKAAAALVTGAVALLVVSASPRDRAARWLGVFLGLISMNQAAETLRALSPDDMGLVWYRVATVAASLDPPALVFFVATLAEVPLSWRRLVALCAPAAALALLAGWALPDFDHAADSSATIPALLALYTLLAYAWAWRLAWGRLVGAPMDPRWRALAVAMTLAALPLGVRVWEFVSHLLRPWWDLNGPQHLVVASLVFAGSVAIVVLAAAQAPRGAWRPVGWGLAAAVGLFLVLKTFNISAALSGAVEQDLPSSLHTPGRAVPSVRWLLIGGLVSAAVFRDRALVASIPARRRSAHGFVALALLVGATLLVAAMNVAQGGILGWFDIGILLLVLAFSPVFGRVVDRVAARVYGVPRRGDIAAAHDVYRRAAAEAFEAGRRPEGDEELARLRDDLGIEEPAARALERIAAVSPGSLRAGMLLAGRYRVDRLLGSGGGGRTFAARDELLGRAVAIKEIVPHEPGAALREARAASLVRHPGVVAVHDVIVRDETVLLIVELAEGGTLAERVAERGPLAGEDAVETALTLIDAVAALHEAGVVHGDLKPANVLLDARGRPKITDFGLSRGATTTVTTRPAGTPAYMAPEVSQGAIPDTRADVYALGLILLRSLRVPALSAVATRAVEQDPAARWVDARAMGAAAQAALRVARRTEAARRL